jgi:disulfide bond formation protein DsbB
VEWRPTEVISPETGMPFTESGAWMLIASLLGGSHAWQTAILEKPPGQKALTLSLTLPGNMAPLYIKVHMLEGMVYCRSFSLSDRKTKL